LPRDSRLCSNGGMTQRAKSASPSEQTALLRQLPSVDELLLRPRVAALTNSLQRNVLVDVVRGVLARLRREIVSGGAPRESDCSSESIERHIVEAIEKELAPSLRGLINASGVILHTNLGRAPLPASIVSEFLKTATQYCNLEYDVTAGTRGKRDAHTSGLIERLTGAEAAIVVNNCAAAVLVALAALARHGEVLVSRGELIEIGDGFRIPEIMEQSGAVLREVGTTNRTRLADYENALNEKTRVILRVHPSNFSLTGFTEKPQVSELIAFGQRTAVMRAGAADRKKLIATPCKQDTFLTHVTGDHLPVGKVAGRNTELEIGPGRFCLRIAHALLRSRASMLHGPAPAAHR